MTTTKSGKAGNRTFATASVVISTATLSDSANSFTQADVGLLVTTTNVPAATTILSVAANGATATMSANATATSGPQSCTLSPNYLPVTLDSVGCVTVAPSAPLTLAPGQLHNTLRACNQWHNAGGAGEHSLMAQKIAAAQGMSLQEA